MKTPAPLSLILRAMTFTDYLVDIALIAVVLLQVKGRRLSARALLLPVAICVWAGAEYLHGIPTTGNDLVLVGVAAGAGVALGALTAAFTRVTTGADGRPFVKAGVAAAVLWVAGVGTRFAFQFYASHGGEGAIQRFSAAHAITSGEAWVAALLLMAFGEVLARTLFVAYRAYRAAPESFLGKPKVLGSSGETY